MTLPFKCPKCQKNDFIPVKEQVGNIATTFIVCNSCHSGIGVYNDHLQKSVQSLTKELAETQKELKGVTDKVRAIMLLDKKYTDIE